jgi:hypothetical protein
MLASVRAAHITAFTTLGFALLFVFPSTKERHLLSAKEAVDRIETAGLERLYKARAHAASDPSLEWLLSTNCTAGPCGLCRERACVIEVPVFDASRQAKEFGSLYGLDCPSWRKPPTREEPCETRGFKLADVYLVDATPDDALHLDLSERGQALREADQNYWKAHELRSTHCWRYRKLQQGVGSKVANRGSCDAAETALAGAFTEYQTRLREMEEGREALARRSGELQNAIAKGQLGHTLVAKFVDGESTYHVTIQSKPERTDVVTVARYDDLKLILASGQWDTLRKLDKATALAFLDDQITEARLGGELLGIRLSGGDFLRWFGLVVGFLSVYAAYLATKATPDQSEWWPTGRAAVFVSIVTCFLAGGAVWLACGCADAFCAAESDRTESSAFFSWMSSTMPVEPRIRPAGFARLSLFMLAASVAVMLPMLLPGKLLRRPRDGESSPRGAPCSDWFFGFVACAPEPPALVLPERRARMSTQSDELDVTPVKHPDSNKRRKAYGVLRDVGFQVDGSTITVPASFQCDGANIPRPLWNLVGSPFQPEFMPAAVLHDWLYHTHATDRALADRAFLSMLRQWEVGVVRAWLVYSAVRLFGFSYWRNGPDDLAYIDRLCREFAKEGKNPELYGLRHTVSGGASAGHVDGTATGAPAPSPPTT